MPSPAYLFRDLYTVLELQTMLRELATTGQITSISGAAKSSSFSRLDPKQFGIELRAELNRLTGRRRASRVQSRFYDTGYSEGGAITNATVVSGGDDDGGGGLVALFNFGDSSALWSDSTLTFTE